MRYYVVVSEASEFGNEHAFSPDHKDTTSNSSDENPNGNHQNSTGNRDIILTLLHLIQSQNFIRVLENTLLNNGDLSEEQLEHLHNPPQEVFFVNDPNELYSLKQYLAAQNASQHTYIEFQGNHNSQYPDDPMLFHSQIKSKVAQWSGVEPMVHDMYPNSCIAYTGPFSELEGCPRCLSSRWDEFQLKASKGKKQALWRNPKIAHYMRYCQEKTVEILQRIMIVQLYCDKKSDCWFYIFVSLQLPPQMRYKKKYVIPGAVVPGPNKPKEMESFLFLGFHHTAALQKEATADGPGSIYITCLVGHTGTCPCWLYCGIKGHQKPMKSCYYPVLLKLNNHNVPGSDHPDIKIQDICGGSMDEYNDKLTYLLKSWNHAKYKHHRKDTGISKQSLVSGLPREHRLPLVSTFAGDSMHVTTLNLGDLFPLLW
ncbi:hypothetical protein K439DRAFT_1647026 [Ramaria rubella]|nr:hypothetical protein K439DRAFT_1647026 [Ramaria rubella]